MYRPVGSESGSANEEKIGSVPGVAPSQEQMSQPVMATTESEAESAASKQSNETMSHPLAVAAKEVSGSVAGKQSNEKKFGGLTFSSLLRRVGWSDVTADETVPKSAAEAKAAEELRSGGQLATKDASENTDAVTQDITKQTTPEMTGTLADSTHAPQTGVPAAASSQVSLPDCRWCEYRHPPEAACEDVCRYNHGDEYRTRTGRMLNSASVRRTPCTQCGHTHPTWLPHGPRPEVYHSVRSDEPGARSYADHLLDKQATVEVLAAGESGAPKLKTTAPRIGSKMSLPPGKEGLEG